jgi:hypothetical protein
VWRTVTELAERFPTIEIRLVFFSPSDAEAFLKQESRSL